MTRDRASAVDQDALSRRETGIVKVSNTLLAAIVDQDALSRRETGQTWVTDKDDRTVMSTKMHSPEEKRAIQEAEEKMQELIKRHARHKDEVDRMLAGEEEPEETRDITPEEVPKGITVEELEQAAWTSC